MKQLIKNMSLATKLNLTFTTILIVSLLIQIGVVQVFFKNFVMEKTKLYYQQAMTQTIQHIDATLFSYEKMSRNILISDTIQAALKGIKADALSFDQASRAIQNDLSEITLSEEGIHSIQIIPMNNRAINYSLMAPYASYESIQETEWYQEIRQSNGELIWLSELQSARTMYGTDPTHVFTAVRKLKDLDTAEELGILLINIDESYIRKILRGIEREGQSLVYLLDEKDDIISHKDIMRIGTNFAASDQQNKDYFILQSGSEKTGWKIIGMIPKEEYIQEFSRFNIMYIYLAIVLILALYILSRFLKRSVTHPIEQIMEGIEAVKVGNFDTEIVIRQKDELGQLANHFNRMRRELKFFIRKMYIQEINRRNIELKAIQSKLNPHFLYNTLDTIYWMLVIEGNEKVSELVVALSDILRYSINDKKEFVTVEEDMMQLENYIAIQKSRFKEKIEFEIDIAPEMRNYYIPKLIVQPIIENSIIHGFEHAEYRGKIRLRGCVQEEGLVFSVDDNGCGITDEKIRKVFTDTDTTKSDRKGLGLTVVHERIKLLYGEPFGLSIMRKEDRGTLVEIKLDFDVKGDRYVENSFGR